MIPMDYVTYENLADRLFDSVWDHLKNKDPKKSKKGSCKDKDGKYIDPLYPLFHKVKTAIDDEKNSIKEDLRYLITATPAQLRKIVKSRSRFAHLKKWDFRLLFEKFSDRRGVLGKTLKYSAETMVLDMGLTVCPYCNRNFINNITENIKIRQKDVVLQRRSSQLDHFFPKDLHSYLALSFFNLIPTCASCNHKKHNDSLNKSPYEIKDVDEFIRFNYTWKKDYLKDDSQIKIEMKGSDQGDNSYKKRLGLGSHYTIHKDYVSDLLKRQKMYEDSYQKELLSKRAGLFNSEEELHRILWGNYTSKEDLLKRPLAKLTRDILRDIDPRLLDD